MNLVSVKAFIRLKEGLTRINVKVKASDEETEINGRGPIIADDELQALYAQLDTLTEQDTLILAGSIPSSLPSDMYEIIMKRLANKHIRIVVDATKDLLTRVLPYKPFLIKPNNHELSEIFGRTLSTKDDLVTAAKNYSPKVHNMCSSPWLEMVLSWYPLMVLSIQVLHLKERLLTRWCRRFYGSWFHDWIPQHPRFTTSPLLGYCYRLCFSLFENLATKDEVLALLNTIR